MRSTLLLFALALPALLFSAFAAPRPSALLPAAIDGEIGEQMEILSAGVRRLRRILDDEAQRAECLEVLASVQSAVLTAKLGTPPMTASLPEADRAAFVAGYRRTIATLLTRLLEVEIALLDGEAEKAKEAFERVRAMENTGHERYTEGG